jgi:uncharacterized protein HemX
VTQPTEPPTTQALPTTTEYKIPIHHTHSHPHPPPTTTEHNITPPRTPNADSVLGGHHGPGVAVIAGVSASVVVLVVLAAVVITAIVVYVVWKKQAPQSRGFSNYQ